MYVGDEDVYVGEEGYLDAEDGEEIYAVAEEGEATDAVDLLEDAHHAGIDA